MMTIDPDRRMTPEQIRVGARRMAWASPAIFLIMFLVTQHQGLATGTGLLLSLCTTVAPWLLALPIIIWGGRAADGLGIIAAILRIFEN
jgi:hypothetical protein